MIFQKVRPTHMIFESALAQPEIEAIINLAPKVENGEVEGDHEEMRRSKIAWIHNEQLQMRLWQFANIANVERFRFNVMQVSDIQYTEYHAKDKGHYDWHEDVLWLNNERDLDRKLSVTVQLSDSDDYEGGDFEIRDVALPQRDLRKKGTVLVFPSYLEHRVTPVTKGVRKSLVTWFEGPPWS